MKIAMVSLITKTADLPQKAVPPMVAGNLAPQSDCDLNIVELARHVALLGHEVTVFAADAFLPKERCPPEKGLSIDYLTTRAKGALPPAIWPFTPSLAGRVARDRYDVIMTTELFQPATLLAWWANKGLAGRAFVWQELDILWRGPAGKVQHAYYRSLGRKVAQDSTGIITRSISARSHLEEEGVPSRKISRKVVHSGVNCDRFRPLDRSRARSRFGLEGFEDVLLCVGRLHPNKGMDRLVNIMPRLLEERKDAVLVLKGTGPQEEELRRLVASLGMDEHIRIITEHIPLDDMPWLFNSADMLAVSSRIDLFPFTAIEANSCGVPVATSFARGLKTDIVEKGGGFILPEDEPGMTGKLIELLSDKAQLRSVGVTSRQLAETEFCFKVGAQRLVEIFGGGLDA